MKKEHCFSIAIESDEKPMTVLGAVVMALHKAGFEYMSVKEIAAQTHWHQAAQPTTGKGTPCYQCAEYIRDGGANYCPNCGNKLK